MAAPRQDPIPQPTLANCQHRGGADSAERREVHVVYVIVDYICIQSSSVSLSCLLHTYNISHIKFDCNDTDALHGGRQQ